MPSSNLDQAPDYGNGLLVTDLYEMTMLEAYLSSGMRDRAIFEFFVRKLPRGRSFLMAAGLEQVVRFLLQARCSEDELVWLRRSDMFSPELIDFLASFQFTGNVEAIPEGTLFFADEPVVRVSAPLLQAQLVETRLINFLQYQTLVATKAARMILAAPSKDLIDFGLRRAHSGEAGVLAARASYIAGFAGTATVPAGMLFGIPIFGTMAHSYVQVHGSEKEAFLSFAHSRAKKAFFLIDTYDTERAARKVTGLAPSLAAEGIAVRGVRIDSGDLGRHARNVRAILDEGGLKAAQIMASGGIDEYRLRELTRTAAPIDSYGIGTSLVVSDDAPALDCAYKLKAYAGEPKRKRSEGKAYWPGPTQIFRRYGQEGRLEGDVVGCADEHLSGEPLLRPVIVEGKLVVPLPELAALRKHAHDQLQRLPEELKPLDADPCYPVEISSRLRRLADEVDQKHGN
jgi:nicotinate phosphoribosyltransferase